MNEPASGANAREIEYWNSATTRSWSERHEPIDAVFAPLTEFALDRAAPAAGESVLDIGCGSGTTVLALADRVGARGRVLGVDIAAPSVARARERLEDAGMSHARVIVADASVHAFEPRSFDLVFSRFGVMFFGDPVASFANIRGALKPGGRLTLATFRTSAENRWSSAALEAVQHLLPPPAPPPGPEAPGQFSWADPARVHRILAGTGFRDVTLTPHDPPMRVGPRGGAAEAAELSMRIGPVVRALIGEPESRREAVRAELEAFFARHDGPDGIVLPGAVWVISAQA